MGLLSSIARGFGLEAKRTDAPRLPSAAGGVVPDLALWSQGSRLGGGISPRAVTSIYRSADAGNPRQLMDLANECRQRDAHLQAVLSVSDESIAGLKWQLRAPEGDKEKLRDKKAREWCEGILRASPDFRRAVAHLAGSVYYSFSVVETVWARVDGKVVPAEFKTLQPRRFGFRLADGRFVWRDENMDYAGVDIREDYPNRFVVSQPRINGDVPAREGLARVLIWYSIFRNWAFADWLKTAETSWKPWRIGTYKKGNSDPIDKEQLEDVLRRLTTDGAAVIPDSSSVSVQWPTGSGSSRSTHGELVNVLGQEMSKAVLGQTETTQSSASSGYAQAKVHDSVKRDLLESRAQQIAADITRDLIAVLIRLNFGPSVLVPIFEFATQDPVDLTAFAIAVKNFSDAGVIMPQRWVRDQAGIPEPEEDEECINGESDEEVPDPNAPNPNGDPNDPKDPNDPNADPATEEEDPNAEGGKKLDQAA